MNKQVVLKYDDLSYGDVFELDEWMHICDCGGFIDYDGHGYLAVGDGHMVSDVVIIPSKRNQVFNDNSIWATHVVWYNK